MSNPDDPTHQVALRSQSCVAWGCLARSSASVLDSKPAQMIMLATNVVASKFCLLLSLRFITMKAFIGRLTWSVEEDGQTSETLRTGEVSRTTCVFGRPLF